ncbi:P-loop containing nucleoside triphosphate hydrolase protein [Penicillium macrosclerotiorum]|uniref:P-loop containing nucleoside triphosphate hydrolase protein n=1 Tax=Penicillium macrosclerotiorum TaxID=303699 RepID=UPI002547F490|nr:P-loop containing nucleoside triphosphate hydrolase protein [Penicillium macrosclerotiorum]KAJ5692603.1 P-loop containing nucleoside triphosphate hydrolase protein [Penicillium macrosclerotiorum]
MDALQRFLYGFPEPALHKRSRPVQVLCLGLPRTGTESLSVALRTLGLETYHGWDVVFEPDGSKLQHLQKLVRRKYNGINGGDVHISSAEFDIVLGDHQAVIDSLPAFFAPELLAAYPDAKVILNLRPDVDAWHRSVEKTIVQSADQPWSLWVMHWFSAELFWLYSLYLGYGYPAVFRSLTGSTKDGVQRNSKWVYRDHCNMVRGMVPKEKLLEWSVEDGWEPLCKFLEVPVPNEPFPKTNNPSNFADRTDKVIKQRMIRVLRNMLLTTATLGGISTAAVMWWQGRIPEVTQRLGDLFGGFIKLGYN